MLLQKTFEEMNAEKIFSFVQKHEARRREHATRVAA